MILKVSTLDPCCLGGNPAQKHGEHSTKQEERLRRAIFKSLPLLSTDFYHLDFRVCHTHLQVSVQASTKNPVLTKDGPQWHHQWCNPSLILVIVALERNAFRNRLVRVWLLEPASKPVHEGLGFVFPST